jgi:putative glutamine amidotransferase
MKHFLYILFFAAIVLQGCNTQDGPAVVAVSYLSGNPEESNYIKWLKSVDPELSYRVMNQLPMDSVEIVFDNCAALLLTGGEDIYPGRYGQAEDTVNCGTINHYRDSLEFLLIDLAMENKTPVIGICRGQQILNVAMGGTLIVDIPTELHTRVYHRCYDWQNCFHDVTLIPNQQLAQLSGVMEGNVTSNHHQAVKKLADPFRVLATANDGIVESIGWKEPEGKPWLLAVQWHPERMDSTNMLSRPLAEKFLVEARNYQRK